MKIKIQQNTNLDDESLSTIGAGMPRSVPDGVARDMSGGGIRDAPPVGGGGAFDGGGGSLHHRLSSIF